MLRLGVLLYDHILLLGHAKTKLMPMLMPLLRLELESEYESGDASLKGKSMSLSLSLVKGLGQCMTGR